MQRLSGIDERNLDGTKNIERKSSMRKSKTSQRRKRKKRIIVQTKKIIIDISADDRTAAKQGQAMTRQNKQVIHAPRLNFTYRVGDTVISSGKSHRRIG